MYLPLGPDRSLVVNQLSGAVMIVDRPWWESLDLSWPNNRIKPGNLQTDYSQTGKHQEILDRLGFLLTPERYRELQDKLSDFGKLFQKERQTTFFITPQTQKNGCPLSCVYCFQKTAGEERHRLLETGGAKAVLDFIKSYQKNHELPAEKICLQLFGGEPVQDRFHDFWKEILLTARQENWRWAVVTSGATFSPKMFQLFANFKADGLQEFNITLDGQAKVHDSLRPLKSGKGTYELIVKNVTQLLDQNLPVLLKTNFGKDNIDHYREHLDEIMSMGWHRKNLVLMVNVIQPFGEIEISGQKISEEILMLKVIEIFREEKYRPLVPILRLEGKKLTGYLANAFKLPFTGTESSRRGKPVFDGYPYHAFCNPTKGNSWNISPDGSLRTCNWMDGHDGFSEGTIFDDVFKGGRFINHISGHEYCKNCDISTLCGGGCPIDMKVRPNYFETCRENHGKVIENFVQGCIKQGWLDLSLDELFRVLRSGFEFDYQYRDRFDPETRISDPGVVV